MIIHKYRRIFLYKNENVKIAFTKFIVFALKTVYGVYMMEDYAYY